MDDILSRYLQEYEKLVGMKDLALDLQQYALTHSVNIKTGRDVLEAAIQSIYLRNIDMIKSDVQNLENAVENFLAVISSGHERLKEEECDLEKGNLN